MYAHTSEHTDDGCLPSRVLGRPTVRRRTCNRCTRSNGQTAGAVGYCVFSLLGVKQRMWRCTHCRRGGQVVADAEELAACVREDGEASNEQ